MGRSDIRNDPRRRGGWRQKRGEKTLTGGRHTHSLFMYAGRGRSVLSLSSLKAPLLLPLQESLHKVPKSAPQVVLERMQVTLHATRRTLTALRARCTQ